MDDNIENKTIEKIRHAQVRKIIINNQIKVSEIYKHSLTWTILITPVWGLQINQTLPPRNHFFHFWWWHHNNQSSFPNIEGMSISLRQMIRCGSQVCKHEIFQKLFFSNTSMSAILQPTVTCNLLPTQIQTYLVCGHSLLSQFQVDTCHSSRWTNRYHTVSYDMRSSHLRLFPYTSSCSTFDFHTPNHHVSCIHIPP